MDMEVMEGGEGREGEGQHVLERSGGVTRNTAAGDHRGAERISLHVFLGGSWGNPMHAHNTRLDSESHPNVSPKPTRTANRPDPHEDSVLSSVRPLRCPHGCAIYTTHTTIPLSCCEYVVVLL